MKERPVLITTLYRGVFAGMIVEDEGDTVTLENARMCVYWPSNIQGVIGLAATGPNGDCRITPATPRLRLHGVTAVMDLTEEAARAWESGRWS